MIRPEYKRIKKLCPHCPICKEELSGNNSIMNPWNCSCGVWVAVGHNFIGQYDIQKKLDI